MYSEISFTVHGYSKLGSAVWQLITRRVRLEVAKRRMGYTLDDVIVSHSQSTDVLQHSCFAAIKSRIIRYELYPMHAHENRNKSQSLNSANLFQTTLEILDQSQLHKTSSVRLHKTNSIRSCWYRADTDNDSGHSHK